MDRLYVADRETGTFIELVETISNGEEIIEQFEELDRSNGVYVENFYDIVDEDHCSVR